MVHWSIADPAQGEGGYPAFQRTAADLELRVRFFLHALAAEEAI